MAKSEKFMELSKMIKIFAPVEYEKYASDIQKVRNEVFVIEQNVPIELEIDGNDENCIHVIVYDSEEPIGTARMEKDGKVGRVAVLKKYRRSGIGKMIMDEIEKIAIKNGLSKIYFHAQTSAIPFYEKIGYLVTSDEYLEAGIKHRTMEKIL